ncbi:MAG: F0F1 ATP synthase subunit gamma, partial [Verrucomicrobiota bacterium]
MTKTMQMVSASKLRRAQDAQKAAKDFADHIHELASRLAASVESADHPLLTRRSEVKKVLMVVFTSDKGLCGGFNNNLCKFLNNWMKENATEGKDIELSFCGRRGHMFFRKIAQCRENYEDVTVSP